VRIAHARRCGTVRDAQHPTTSVQKSGIKPD